MLKSYDKVLDNAAWIKHATIYKETTQAGYEIISFDYPLAPAADLEQIVPDICDSA